MIDPKKTLNPGVIHGPFKAPGGDSHVTVVVPHGRLIPPIAIGPVTRAIEMLMDGWGVISLAVEAQVTTAIANLRVGSFPIIDGVPVDVNRTTLQGILDFVRQGPTYVCCLGGRSRSVALCAAILAIEKQAGAKDFDDALAYIRTVHPSAGPAPEPLASFRKAVETYLTPEVPAAVEAVTPAAAAAVPEAVATPAAA